MNNFKIVTYYLAAANIGVFLWMAFSGVSLLNPSAEALFHWGGSSSYSLAQGEWWRLITSTFIHSGPIHLLLNMYALCLVGPLLEFTLGKSRLLIAYFSTGILASVISCLFHADTPTVGVGASGAIFGLFGILLALLTTRFFIQEARDALIKSFGVTIAMNIAYSFRAGVDFAAHLGGVAAGLLIGYCLYLTFAFPKKSLKLSIYFLIGVIALGGTSFSIRYLKNGDNFVFYELKEKIALEHEEIVHFLSLCDSMSHTQGMEHLEKVIIPKAEAIKSTLKQMASLRLSKEQVKFQQFADELYSLEIEKYHLIVKSIKENTNRYESRLNELNQQCNELVKKQTQGPIRNV